MIGAILITFSVHMAFDPRPLHKTLGVMVIIVGAVFVFVSFGNTFNVIALIFGIAFVIIGFEIIRYSQKDSHYNSSSKRGES